MKKDNRGFTLVELLVAVAILGIVSLMAVSFVSAGASSYRSVSTAINLQVQSQLTMSQLQEYMIDCNEGICFSGNTLYILNSEEVDDGTGAVDTVYTAHIFTFEPALECIYLRSVPVTFEDDGSATIAAGTNYLLSNYVSDLYAFISSDGSSVDVEITFYYAGKTYTGTQTIALRNTPKTALDIESLLKSCAPETVS